MGDMNEWPEAGYSPVDRLLEDAGARWRGLQPDPKPVDASLFLRDRKPRLSGASTSQAWSFLAGSAATLVIMAGLLVVAPNSVPRIGGNNQATPDALTGYIATGLANCPLTKPDGSFKPPVQPGADYEIEDHLAWYGTEELWTLLHRRGEVWTGLPASETGMPQKTTWWREGYDVTREPEPQIYVSGERLDAPGRFGFGPGTNAFWGLGSAMLVGIDVPGGGCWEITARYYAESLSYVVWISG